MARGYLVGNPCLRENSGSLSAMHVHDMLKGESFAARLSLHSSLLPSQKCSGFCKLLLLCLTLFTIEVVVVDHVHTVW
jgi:hypothetical protein